MLQSPHSDNRLLAALPRKEFKSLNDLFERVELVYNKPIYEPGEPIRYVYFPESGIISLLASVGDNSTIEVGIVGNEGMAGLSVFLGFRTSSNAAVVQGSGTALRIASANFLEYSAGNPKLQRILLSYMHSLMTQISQSAACNRFHHIDERLARWLLMTQDRMNSDEFRITQEFLSNMLGIRREAVNKAAGALQERGFVSYVRGSMKIQDRGALERSACHCYELIKQEYSIGNGSS